MSARLGSASRGAELGLLIAPVALVLLGWRSLEASGVALPSGTGRIVTQFLLTAFAGHAGLRVFTPHAAPVLYPVAMVLAATGLIATLRLAPSSAGDQAHWISLGTAAMVTAAALRDQVWRLRTATYTSAAVAAALLVLTGIAGTTINGARLWFSVGGQLVQTTELIKLLVVVFLAGFLSRHGPALGSWSTRLGGRRYSALPVAAPLVLALSFLLGTLALLRDLGSVALLLALTTTGLVLATGKAWLAAIGLGLLVVVGAAGYVTFDHVEERVDVWLDPHADPLGSGFQTLQSSYAIAAGGVTGEGWGRGSPQSIPAASTDYVFSAVAEELGLLGAAAVIALYVTLAFGGLRVALDARDGFQRMLAALASLLIASQAAIIIAGNLRLIPTTGITLPFVSYGGSSLVVNFVLVGLVLAISAAGPTPQDGAAPTRR